MVTTSAAVSAPSSSFVKMSCHSDEGGISSRCYFLGMYPPILWDLVATGCEITHNLITSLNCFQKCDFNEVMRYGFTWHFLATEVVLFGK